MASSDSDPASDGSPPSPPGGVAARASRSVAASGRSGMVRDLDHASVLVGEMLGGVLVWGGIGWFVGTTWAGHPWLFIVGSLLGFAGGFYMLWLRSEGRIGSSRGARTTARARRAGDQGPDSGTHGNREGA